MKNVKEDLLRIRPVETYEAPQLPTLEDARNTPALLKKLPSRWLKHAAVIACIGLMGTVALSGCVNPSDRSPHHGGAGGAPIYVAQPTEYELHTPLEYAPLELKLHHGGSGAGPFYIVHITEQEALGIVRAQLETAGLHFGTTPPDIRASSGFMAADDIGLDLFDEEKGIAVALIDWEDANQPFSPRGGDLVQRVIEDFSQQTDMPIGVFYNPGETVGGAAWWFEGEEGNDGIVEPTEERKAEARPVLIENLTAQVQGFIAWLQAEGILS